MPYTTFDNNSEKIHSGKKKYEDCFEEACTAFEQLSKNAEPKEGCSQQEVLASEVYALFARDNASKSIAAQYLSELLVKKHEEGHLTTDQLKSRLPSYLVAAIEYVTGFGPEIAMASVEGKNG